MLIYYHHILKTGGTAIHRWMQDRFKLGESVCDQYSYKDRCDLYIHNHLIDLKIFPQLLQGPIRHIISIRDPITRHISKMNWGLQQKYNDWDDMMLKDDQYNFLNTNLSQMNSYEFIRQEFHQEDFNRAFKNDDVLKLANVSKVKEYSWDKMSEEEKDNLRQRYEPEYSMLKSLGIEYNIP